MESAIKWPGLHVEPWHLFKSRDFTTKPVVPYLSEGQFTGYCMNLRLENPGAHKFIPGSCYPCKDSQESQEAQPEGSCDLQGEVMGSAVSTQLIRTKQGLKRVGFGELPVDP